MGHRPELSLHSPLITELGAVRQAWPGRSRVKPSLSIAGLASSPRGGDLAELAFSRKTDAVKLAVKIGAPSVGFARPYSHIGHLPARSIERFDLDRAVRQFRSALAIRSFYEFLRDTQLGPGHPEKQRDHRGFHGYSPRIVRGLAGGNDRSMARSRLPPSDTSP
jgi:hypothetical protein